MVEPTDGQSSIGGFVNMVGVAAGSKQRKNRKKKNVVFGAGGLAPVRRHAGDAAEPPSDALRDDALAAVDDDDDHRHARPKAPTTVSPTVHRRKKPQQVLAKEDDDEPLPSSSSSGSHRANEARQQAQQPARRGRKKNNYQHRAPQQHKQRQATANPSRRVSPSAAESSGDEASRVTSCGETPYVSDVLRATAPDPSLDSSSATSSCEIRPEEDDDDLILARHLEYIYEATDHLLCQHAALAAPNVASPLLCATQPQTCRLSSRYPHYDATKVGLPCAVAQSTELRAGRCTKL